MLPLHFGLENLSKLPYLWWHGQGHPGTPDGQRQVLPHRVHDPGRTVLTPSGGRTKQRLSLEISLKPTGLRPFHQRQGNSNSAFF